MKFHKIEKIVASLQPKTVLDFGCGCASDSFALASEASKHYVYDINSKCKELVEYRISKYKNTNVEWIPLLDIRSKKFDLVVCIDVVEHLPQLDEFIEFVGEVTDTFLFTKAFGVHDQKKGGFPQHFDTDWEDVKKSLIAYGFHSIKVDMAFPPQLWSKVI